MRALGVLLALVAVVAVACGGEQGAQGTTTTTTEPPAETGTTTTTTGDASRPKAPSVEGTTLDGETLSLADFRGKPVLVNVWSSW